MGSPTRKSLATLFARSGNRCAFLGCSSAIVECSETVTGEICHIKANSRGGPRFDSSQSDKDRQAYDNLILLCRRHHRIVDQEPKTYTSKRLLEIKRLHEDAFSRDESAIDYAYAKMLITDFANITISKNTGNVAINSPGAIQSQNVQVFNTGGRIVIAPPPGTIGENQKLSRYVSYLIRRYNEFASKDRMRRTQFSFGAISKNIEHKFGAQWKLLPQEKFDELCVYLQGRVERTLIAKQNLAKGYKLFSTFDEHTNK